MPLRHFDLTCFGKYSFRGSSVVERLAVNELVVGSNPTRGAGTKTKETRKGLFRFIGSDKRCVLPEYDWTKSSYDMVDNGW